MATQRSTAVERREWKWVVAVTVTALVVTSLPYLLGLALQGSDRVFGGFVYNVEDCYSYLTKMRQGAEGAWLFHFSYTPEPHRGTILLILHLVQGKLAALLPGSDLTARLVWGYHIARLLWGTTLLLTVYRFLAEFTPHLAVRRLAFLIVAFGGGLGWLLIVAGQPGWLGSMPLDLILPEGFTFLVLYAFPHIALARTLLLWGLLFLLRAWRDGAPRFAVLSGLTWLGMGLVVPFYVAVAWAVMGASWLALTLRRGTLFRPRAWPWREAGLALPVAALSVPIVIYSAWVFTSDPVYAAWGAQNVITSPHPLHYLAAFGVELALALLVAPRIWRAEGPGWVALAWVAVVPLLVYLPFNLQRRLAEGVQVALAYLSAAALHSFGLRGKRWRVAAALLLLLLIPTNGLLVAGNCAALLSRPPLIFRPRGEVAAMDWLSGQVEPNDVIIAAYESGNYLPVRVGARVVVGHGPESVHSAEKRELVGRFFAAATSDDWRHDLLTEYGVDWVFWGPAERALGGFDPRTAPYLEPVYEADGYTILKVSQ